MNSISGKWQIIIAFLSCLFVAGLVCLFFNRSSGVPAIKYTIQTNNYMSISQIKFKKIKDIDPIKKGGNIVTPKTALCQWQCIISNISECPISYSFDVVFSDKDGFVLHKKTFKGFMNFWQLDLNQSQNIYSDLKIEYDLIDKLDSCKITLNPTPLMTEAEKQKLRAQQLEAERLEREQQAEAKLKQLEAERLEREQQAEAKLKQLEAECQEREQQAEAKRQEREQQLAAEKAAEKQEYERSQQNELNKWKKLQIGMTKKQVAQILGKPESIRTHQNLKQERWEYTESKGFGLGGSVEFREGKLSSWDAPYKSSLIQ